MFPKNEPAVIVFDGTSYYGLFTCDVKDAKENNPDIKVIANYPYWSDEMDQLIEDLNNEI